MMSTRPAIPPSGRDKSPSRETLRVLQHRLNSAEDDTKQLMEQLSSLGFTRDAAKGAGPDGSEAALEPLTPYRARLADADVLQQNYETLVSRVCKMESAVQTLKMNLLRSTTERDLSKKEKVAVKERMSQAAEIYEMELAKLNQGLVKSRRETKEVELEKRKLLEETHHLQQALDVATAGQTASSSSVEELMTSKQKLQRRMNEIREEMAREVSLRTSLETSHTTLLQRVKDMEEMVAREKDSVQNMNTASTALKRDLMRAEEEARNQADLRRQVEESLQVAKKQSGMYVSKVRALEKDKELLVTELGKMGTQYQELNHQLDEMYRIMNEKKSSEDLLEKQNSKLQEAIKTSATENAALIKKYERELEVEKAEAAAKAQDAEKVRCLREQIKQEARDRTKAESKVSLLEEQVEDLEGKVERLTTELTETKQRQSGDATRLKEKLKALTAEKERALKDKDVLLDEVNQAVDGMSEERTRLEDNLQKAQVDIQALERAKAKIGEENAHLLQRLGTLEEQQGAQQQVQHTMSSMMDQKNKLAYEKGQLQSRITQLQKELENMAEAQNEYVTTKKLGAILEAKLQKTQDELESCRIHTQRLESQLKHSHNSGERKEEDFSRAIKARDEAVREVERLLAIVDEHDEREQQKIANLTKNLNNAREDNRKIASTLEGVMVSHSQMQNILENLQVELGKKDSLIAQLQKDKTETEFSMRQLEKEIENLQTKLVGMESVEMREIGPLRQALQKCKSDNAKMAASLETVVKSNSQLQGVSQSLQDQLEKKIHIMEQLQTVREKDAGDHKQEIRKYEERLTNLKESLNKERDKTIKKTNKDILEVKKQLDDLASKNGELSRANSDLRHKVTELEYHVKETKEKCQSQKSHIEHLTKVRQKQEETIEGLRGIGTQLTEMESTKNLYTKKTEEQSKTIKDFMKQTAELQKEVQALAQTQVETAELIQQQEADLEKERNYSEQLRRKYKQEIKKREKQLEDLKRQTEERLREANDESMHASHNLVEAHDWFKTRFDTLQSELGKAKHVQQDLERENYTSQFLLTEEKRKAEETARKAKEMIKASRETISRLADYAELTQAEQKMEARELKQKLKAEKDQTKYAKKKLKQFQEASLRHTEDLARELESTKMQSLLYS